MLQPTLVYSYVRVTRLCNDQLTFQWCSRGCWPEWREDFDFRRKCWYRCNCRVERRRSVNTRLWFFALCPRRASSCKYCSSSSTYVGLLQKKNQRSQINYFPIHSNYSEFCVCCAREFHYVIIFSLRVDVHNSYPQVYACIITWGDWKFV